MWFNYSCTRFLYQSVVDESSVTTLEKKLIFVLFSNYQMQIASWLLLGQCTYFIFYILEFCLAEYAVLVYSITMCANLYMHQSCGRSVSLKTFTNSAFTICLFLIVYRYLDIGEKGLILASQVLQVSHTLHIASSKFLLILVYCTK